jgi:DNA anti-recombination protein RmuC
VATMIAELYDALVKAGADDVSARSAAVAVADYDRRLADVGLGLQRLETKVEMGFVEVGARFAEARTESDARFNQVHMRLAELRAESDARFNQVHVRLAELRAEMDTRFAELRREMDTRFVQLDTRSLSRAPRWQVSRHASRAGLSAFCWPSLPACSPSWSG